MKRLCSLAVSALALVGGPAIAGEKHAAKHAVKSQGNPVYPKFEKQYEKRFTQPTLNCGACWGYYRPTWTSWAEACGQPEPIYAAAPQVDAKPVEPKLMTPDPKPVDPKVPDPKPLPDPKPADLKPKQPEVAPPPLKTPDPVPLPDPKPIEPKKPGESGKTSMLPPAAVTVSISIPQVEPDAPPSIPLVPVIPAVNVK